MAQVMHLSVHFYLKSTKEKIFQQAAEQGRILHAPLFREWVALLKIK